MFYNSSSILDFSTATTWPARRLPGGGHVRDLHHSHSKSKQMNQDEMLNQLSSNILSKGPEQPLWLVLEEPINMVSKQLLRRVHSKLDPYWQADKLAPQLKAREKKPGLRRKVLAVFPSTTSVMSSLQQPANSVPKKHRNCAFLLTTRWADKSREVKTNKQGCLAIQQDKVAEDDND